MAVKELFIGCAKSSENYILESLFIVMKKKPFSKINISDITMKAGVHRTTFYRNFKNKEDIIKKFYNYLLCEYQEVLAVKNPESPKEHLMVFFECLYKYKSELMLIYTNNLDHYFLEIAKQMYVNKYCNNGVDIEEEFSMSYHYGGVWSILRWWCEHDMSQEPQEMVRIFFNMQGVRLHSGMYMYRATFEQ